MLSGWPRADKHRRRGGSSLGGLAMALVVALGALAVFCAWRWREADRRADAAVGWTHQVMDSLASTVDMPRPPDELGVRDSLYWAWVATTSQLQSRRWQQSVRHWVQKRRNLLEPTDEADLRRQGLREPEKQLRDSLLAHPEIIPFDPVAGGRMHFDPSSVVLLSPPYVFAFAEDGHVGGWMLLEYTLLDGGALAWKRIWWRKE